MLGSNTSPGCLDWLDSLAVIIASGVAIWGINAWRREHVGKRRIDLAEEALALFYEARDVINGSRSAIGSTKERLAAAQAISEAATAPTDSARAAVITWRLYQRGDLFGRIRTLRYRFSAVFGWDAAKSFYDLVALRDYVIAAEEEFLMIEEVLPTLRSDARDKQVSRIKELLPILHHGRTQSDPTTQQSNAIIDRVEQVCRPIIESYGRTLTAAALTRVRRVMGNVPSQTWFVRLRRAWTRISGRE